VFLKGLLTGMPDGKTRQSDDQHNDGGASDEETMASVKETWAFSVPCAA